MKELENTIWVANTLFERGLVTGSTGNISFRDNNIIYISKSGSCFGLINEDSFAKISLDGTILEGKPSKEWPMHLKLYQQNNDVNAVVHTHSFNSTMVSCADDIENKTDLLFKYTPYLKMQTNGNIGVVEYGKPGSQELFNSFFEKTNPQTNTYILKNHGVIVAGESALKAFYTIEEFEQSSKILVNIDKNLKYTAI